MQRHLLVAAVLATMSLLVSGQTDYPDFFYKLSLQWPPSFCATLKPNSMCRETIPETFTIHGLWPQFVKNDTPIPPYDENKCTDVIPTAADQIRDLLRPIQDRLDEFWPNLLKNDNINDQNLEFWQYEWKKHGMCSDYPTEPKDYFTAALDLATQYNVSKGTEFMSRPNPYKAKEISDAINKTMGKYPEISCKKVKKTGTLLVNEIRLCFNRAKPPSVLRDCPTRYSNGCSDDNDQVKFPPPTSKCSKIYPPPLLSLLVLFPLLSAFLY